MADNGNITITRKGHVGYIVCSGRLTEAIVGKFCDEIGRYSPGDLHYVLLDAEQVTDVEAAATRIGGESLRQMKKIGVKRMISFSQSATLRMLASTMTLAAGLSNRFFATRAEAEAAIAELIAKQ